MVVNPAPILVIGHSHTTAIRSAITADLASTIVVLNFGNVYELQARRHSVPTELAEAYAPKHVFCSFGGSEHSVLGLIEAPTPFDFVSEAVPSVEEGRWIVPSDMVRQALHAAMRRKLDLLTGIRQLFPVPVTHLCTPPPFRTTDEPIRLPRRFDHDLERGIVPESIRKKLHHMHSNIVRQHCSEHGIDFLDVPAESMDESGFLRPGLYDRDPTHGNRQYGEIVIRQILEVARV